MKKLLLIFAVLAVLIFLGACGKNNIAETGTPENPYQLVWYNIGTPQKDLDQVIEKANEYLKNKLDIVIDMKLIDWPDYDKKIKMVEASGEPFDLCFTSSWTNDFRLGARKGYFLPLNELLDKYAKETLEAVNSIFFTGTAIDGINYAVPVQKEAAYQLVYYFNQTYVDKYKLDVNKVKNLSDLEPLLKFIKEKEPEIIPYSVWGNMSYLFGDMVFVLDSRIPGAVKIEKGNHTIFNQYENKEFIEKIKIYRKFYQQGFIPQDAPQTFDNPLILKTGKFFVGRGEYQPYSESDWKRNYGYGIIPVPAFTPPVIGNRSIGGAMIAISVTSERPDLAMKFINLLNTDRYLRNLLAYGIESVHYKKVGDRKIEALPEHKNYLVAGFTLGNMFITDTYKGDPDDKWERFKEWNDSAVKSPILGFAFDTDKVKNELSAKKNISDEFCPGLFTGAMDPDETIPKLLKKMKGAGMDKVHAEMQRQLDEWWDKNHKE